MASGTDADMAQVVLSTIGTTSDDTPPHISCNTLSTFLMIRLIRYILGILATVGAAYAAPVLFHFFRALSLVQIG